MTKTKQRLRRVAIIEPVGGHSGMDYYDFGLCTGVTSSGWQAALYSCNKTVAPRSNVNFKLYTFYEDIYGADPAWRRGLRFLRGLFRSLVHAKRTKVDVVHFHFFFVTFLELFSVQMARLMGFRVVVTAHDVESFAAGLGSHRLAKIAYNTAHQIIAHSDVGKRELQASIAVPSHKLHHVPIGNYLHAVGEPITKTDARKLLELPANAQIVLFLGQIKEVKGLDILIRAFAEVQKAHPSAVLVVAGRVWKDDFEVYEELIKNTLRDDACILRIGFVPDELMSAYHHASNIVVLPYRKIYQSASLLMAMAYGVPVLASDIAGMKEIIEDNINGFLFESGSAADLASRLIELLNSEQQLQHVAFTAQEHMQTEYSWERIGRLTSEIYQLAVS